MAYVKNTWVDQEGQVRYRETQDGDLKIFTPNYEQVTEIGTPLNADNMNHIEDGIENNDISITTINNKIPSNASSSNKMATKLDLDDKADADLSNMVANQEAKNTIIAWGLPDWDRGINKAARTTFTADKRGWLQATGYTGGGAVGLKINDAWVARAQADGGDDTGAYACLVPVNVGDTYWSTNAILFIPCKGEI